MRADLCETRRYLKSIASSPKFNSVINKAKLTPTQRKVLIMFIAKGFSVRKISLEMSLSDSSTYPVSVQYTGSAGTLTLANVIIEKL